MAVPLLINTQINQSMDDLPASLVIDILSRLPDAGDLAAARLACRTFRSLSLSVSAVALLCSHRRFLRSRHPATRSLTLPFKTLVLNNLSLLSPTLTDLAIGIEKPFAATGDDAAAADDEELDESDDLHLTATDFVAGWVAIAGERLRRIEMSDYWIQSCWRRSEALAIISDGCGNLLHLVVRNAWLSVEGLKSMPNLTSLTLEFIRLDDEHLVKVNECFPSLQVLNLNGVGGLKEPRIHLPQLRVCHWTVSNFPLSLAIHAPNLTELKLQCVEPKILVLETPLLSHLDLKIRKPDRVNSNVGKLSDLKSVSLESSYLYSLTQLLGNKSVERLELDVPQCLESDELSETVTAMDLVNAFPNIHDLTLGSGAWIKLEKSFGCNGIGPRRQFRNLKKLMVHLPLYYDFTFISYMLNLCVPFSEVILLIHGDVPTAAKNHIISRCKSNFPRIRWRWGMWRKSCEISWICEGDWPFSF